MMGLVQDAEKNAIAEAKNFIHTAIDHTRSLASVEVDHVRMKLHEALMWLDAHVKNSNNPDPASKG